MPSKRTPVERGRRAPPIDETLWRYLHDEAVDLEFAEFTMDLPALWKAHGEQIMGQWVVDHAGTRPSCWWRFEAPRLRDIPTKYRDCFYTADMIEPRRLLRGAGRPAHEVLNVVPSYSLGIPVDWHGFDSANPPAFETQYAYLERHGLLARGEGPAEVEPVVELVTYWSNK
jgi:hypothetical protein